MDNLTVGCIIAWTRERIPAGWHICNGQGGTIDLRGQFIKGASVDGDVGVTGGAEEHSQSYPSTNTEPAHVHGFSPPPASTDTNDVETFFKDTQVFSASHTHSVEFGTGTSSSSDSHSHTTPSLNNATNIPKHITMIFIQKVS